MNAFEGPPEEPKAPASRPLDTDLVAEREPVPIAVAQEAYRTGNREVFDGWLTARQEAIESSKWDMVGKFELDIDLARIQSAAGEREDAIERLAGPGGTTESIMNHIEATLVASQKEQDQSRKENLLAQAAKLESLLAPLKALISEMLAGA